MTYIRKEKETKNQDKIDCNPKKEGRKEAEEETKTDKETNEKANYSIPGTS